MKAFLIGLAIVVFGLGEYAFVEYYPLTPQRRVQKVKKLPVVRSIVKAADMRLIRAELTESEDGTISMYNRGDMQTWDDAEKLYQEYQAGDRSAYNAIEFVRHRDEWNQRLAAIRDRAENGDPSAMRQLYSHGIMVTGEADMNRAIELLESHGSAMAEWYLKATVLRSIDDTSREGILLYARMMQENYRIPFIEEDMYNKLVTGNTQYLENLRQAAQNGDEDAEWVVEQLAAEGQ